MDADFISSTVLPHASGLKVLLASDWQCYCNIASAQRVLLFPFIFLLVFLSKYGSRRCAAMPHSVTSRFLPTYSAAARRGHLLGAVADGHFPDARHSGVHRRGADPSRSSAWASGLRSAASPAGLRCACPGNGMIPSRVTRGRGDVLLCPGPVMLSPGVKRALSQSQIGHRDRSFSDLVARLRRNCGTLLGAGVTAPVRPFRYRSGDLWYRGGLRDAAPSGGARTCVPVNGTFRGTHRGDHQGARHRLHAHRFRIRPAVRPVADRGGPLRPTAAAGPFSWP